jgi:DNA mismatch repair protein MutS
MLLEQKQRCIPEFHEGKEIEIVAGRHPVVEHFLPQHESFIPNDLFTNASEYMHLIT